MHPALGVHLQGGIFFVSPYFFLAGAFLGAGSFPEA